MDLESEGQAIDAAALERLHRAKTGALLSASVRGGAILGGAEGQDLSASRATRPRSASRSRWWTTCSTPPRTRPHLGKTAGKDEAARQGHLRERPRDREGAGDGGRRSAEEALDAVAPLGPRGGSSGPSRASSWTVTREAMTRLDVWLAEQGLAESREKAQALVMAGRVTVDGQKAAKPGTRVKDGRGGRGRGRARARRARGALKLAGALDAFGVDPAGRVGGGRRRFDRRLHRDAARARRRARLRRRRGPRPAPRAAAPGPARRRARPHERAVALARRWCPSPARSR